MQGLKKKKIKKASALKIQYVIRKEMYSIGSNLGESGG